MISTDEEEQSGVEYFKNLINGIFLMLMTRDGLSFETSKMFLEDVVNQEYNNRLMNE